MKLFLSFALVASSLYARMAGPPLLPNAPAAAPAGLAVHPLKAAPAPLDNPLKGFVPFVTKTETDKRQYPYSMEFGYFALNELMLDWDRYDWAPFEAFLTQIASAGHQAVTRVYLEYPDKPSGIPDFLRKSGVKISTIDKWNCESPNYDDPRTLKALTNFIKAWGAKYDGDPRLGFITLGMIGLWGEWHQYPNPELMPNDASAAQIIDAFAASFKKTRLLARYPGIAGGRLHQYPIGFHDDSFAFKDIDKGWRRSVTLPMSLGGASWSFLQSILNEGSENRWIDCPIGGELRPEIQQTLFTDKQRVDNMSDCIGLSHISWMLNHQGVETFKSGISPALDTLVRKMGYNLRLTNAYFNSPQSSQELRVAIQVVNDGVARFYYPWNVVLRMTSSDGKTVKQWDTHWDITQVQPNKIEAYKDWGQKTAMLNFGPPQIFDFKVAKPGLAPGSYSVAIKVVNPMQGTKAKQFRFSNEGQGEDGWMKLGNLQVAQ